MFAIKARYPDKPASTPAHPRHFSLLGAIAFLGALGLFVGPAHAQTVIKTNTQVNYGDLSLENKDIVVQGPAILIINGAHSLRSLTVQNQGVVTCSPVGDPKYVDGVNLVIGTDVNINTGGAIDASGCGYDSQQGPGAGTSLVNHRGGGGAYGGEGSFRYPGEGESGTAYGDFRNITDPGSGGGINLSAGDKGARGGGRIKLKIAGTLTVNGLLQANGLNSANGNIGAGSGGGIWLNVKTLTGTGGIYANGGSAGDGGAGGGGRIALYYTDKSGFTGALQTASGGTANNYAGAGTIYLKNSTQQYGDLLCDSGGLGNVDFSGPYPSLSAILTPTTSDETTNGFIFDNVTVRGKASLATPGGIILKLHVLSKLTVEPSARIDASGRGFTAGNAPSGPIAAVNGRAFGGAYGGETIRRYITEGYNSQVYGNLRDPNGPDQENAKTAFGCGGGAGNGGLANGGNGGGAIRVVVDGTAKIDGTIESSGQAANGNGGSGSGGSVYLNAATLTGTGGIYAVGGSNGDGGPGSGGRIAVYYGDKSGFTGTIRANGNASANTWAAAGTVYFQNNNLAKTNGDLVIDNAANQTFDSHVGSPVTLLTTDETFDNVHIIGSGLLSPASMQRLNLTVTGDCIIDSGAIWAVGKGYAANSGPGVGTSTSAGWSSGSSYGGVGVFGDNNVAPGSMYGTVNLLTDPLSLLFGSGGAHGLGDAINRPGGAGGGAINLIVNGSLVINGSLTADGLERVNNYSRGGTGGSIKVRAGLLKGGGFISSQGLSSSGGGRVALYTTTNQFPDAQVLGVKASPTGQLGTLYKETVGNQYAMTLAATPLSLSGGQTATGSVTVAPAADPAGAGLTINLANGDPAALSMPTSVTIAPGKTSQTFTITAIGVTTPHAATISAKLWDNIQSQTVTVKPWFNSLTFNTNSVSGAATVTGLIKLNSTSAGLTVSLTSADPTTVSVPATVNIPSGATQATFTATVTAPASAKSVIISAAYKGETFSAPLFVNPASVSLKSIVASPAQVLGGSRATAVVTLTGKAPAGGAIVALAASITGGGTPPVTLPASVTIPAGKTSASVLIPTTQVTATTPVFLTGTLGVTQKTSLVVTRVAVRSLDLVPASVTGGDSAVGVVLLDTAAPTPVIVTITSSDPAAIPDQAITIPAGETVGTFNIDTTTVTSITTVTITAQAGGNAPKSKLLTINP